MFASKSSPTTKGQPPESTSLIRFKWPRHCDSDIKDKKILIKSFVANGERRKAKTTRRLAAFLRVLCFQPNRGRANAQRKRCVVHSCVRNSARQRRRISKTSRAPIKSAATSRPSTWQQTKHGKVLRIVHQPAAKPATTTATGSVPACSRSRTFWARFGSKAATDDRGRNAISGKPRDPVNGRDVWKHVVLFADEKTRQAALFRNNTRQKSCDHVTVSTARRTHARQATGEEVVGRR